MSSSINIPKSRCAVEIGVGTAVLSGEVFLAEYALDHAGSERPSDLLNGRYDFFPLLQSDERLSVIARSKLRWMRIANAVAVYVDDPSFAGDGTEIAVRIELEGGAELRGVLRFSAPPGRGRVQDFMNDAPRFFPLYEDATVVLVNRDAVVSVEAVRR